MFAKTRVEGFGAIDPADLINVAKSFGRHQRGLGAVALNDRVDHDGGAVNESSDFAEPYCGFRQTIQHASRQLRRRRQRLSQRQRAVRFIENHRVSERAADINRYPQRNLRNWNGGVMEWWSDGSRPILRYSNTPSLQLF